VVTDRRTYLFDLIASPKAKPLYVLRFTYPEEPEEQQPIVAGAANSLEMAAATDPYAVVDPAELNFEWGRDGDKTLLPARVYDDGNATFLTWPDGSPIPAILIKDHKGVEGPVNFAVRGNMIVVDGVPAEIILRSGDDLASLVNEGPPRPVITSPSSVFAQAEGS
jgi:type IV secretion system protein VirB9